jgi:hypothetical protein
MEQTADVEVKYDVRIIIVIITRFSLNGELSWSRSCIEVTQLYQKVSFSKHLCIWLHNLPLYAIT